MLKTAVLLNIFVETRYFSRFFDEYRQHLFKILFFVTLCMSLRSLLLKLNASLLNKSIHLIKKNIYI